jgi:hypothetical protein
MYRRPAAPVKSGPPFFIGEAGKNVAATDSGFALKPRLDRGVWHVRKWYAEGTPEKVRACAFNGFRLSGLKKYLKIEISVNEDQMISALVQVAKSEAPQGSMICVLPPRGRVYW